MILRLHVLLHAHYNSSNANVAAMPCSDSSIKAIAERKASIFVIPLLAALPSD